MFVCRYVQFHWMNYLRSRPAHGTALRAWWTTRMRLQYVLHVLLQDQIARWIHQVLSVGHIPWLSSTCLTPICQPFWFKAGIFGSTYAVRPSSRIAGKQPTPTRQLILQCSCAFYHHMSSWRQSDVILVACHRFPRTPANPLYLFVNLVS